MSTGVWRIWVDTGGTFTDCVARDPAGGLHRAKVLSSAALRGRVAAVEGPGRLRLEEPWALPDDFLGGWRLRALAGGGAEPVTGYRAAEGILELARGPAGLAAGDACEVLCPEEAPLLAARMVTGTPVGAPLPPVAMRLATTRGTNALLERRGARVALFVDQGLGDLLEIGTQQRPDLFALAVVKPAPLYAAVVECSGRLAADGSVVHPLDLKRLRPVAGQLLADGIEVAAVALLHSYRNPEPERRLAAFLGRLGFRHVSISSELAPLVKILPRAETAVINAYLWEALETYLAAVRDGLGGGLDGDREGRLEGASLQLMTSAGGLVGSREFRPKDGLLSGPAGGVVGAAAAGLAAGFGATISFDMGGTSTDVARFEGDYDYVFETRVGDARLLAPALAIETVAAGGGSICGFDGQRLRVGPESAGAEPGPACYGASGPLTLTDVNLLLGRLAPERFQIPIDEAAAEEAFAAVAARVAGTADRPASRDELLRGFVQIANERMAEAIRRISIRRGYRPADHAMVAFGGAGAQHACALAAMLEIDTVLVPADAGLLSAHGLGHARLERFAERQVLQPLATVEPQLGSWIDRLVAEATAAVAAQGVPAGEVEVRRRLVFLRLAGQETSLPIDWPPPESPAAAFRDSHRDHYGWVPEGRAIEVEALRVVASSRDIRQSVVADEPPAFEAEPTGRRRALIGVGWAEVPTFERRSLRPGAHLTGPALVFEQHSATVVEPGWGARVDDGGCLVLERRRGPAAGRRGPRPRAGGPRRAQAVELELFTHRFAAIAWQMGETLRRTALSVNVKERLDFSCALLDPDGELVVNAPHIPVHLGSLGLCVRSVAAALELGPGDVAVTNHPAYGGSHLPDVTVITPVFAQAAGSRAGGSVLLGYVANRAHHAEIGGSRPGSMPPDARCLAEEGAVLPPLHLLRGGRPRWAAIRRRLEDGPHPSRAVEENLADLAAAVAANHRGAAALRTLAERHGRDRVGRYMRALTDRAAAAARDALRRVGDGRYAASERLDDGSPLAVVLELREGAGSVDFTGSAEVHPGNLNATPAVVRSVVLYVLRLLLAEPLPLNEGMLRAVRLVLPRGILNPEFPDDPRRAPAVVGGNVETSQRLVDVLLRALGLVACSQGTMNNVLFGNRRFGYYETLGGGCGAGPGWAGASAVHSHMTNTAVTDPELLEHRYPVRLERFALRHGSGGAGRFRGGDGLVRELTFLEPVSVSVLGQHRRQGPYGAAGGAPGSPGGWWLERAAGGRVELGSVDGCEAEPGDRLVVETPGGGGWGEPAAP